MDLLSYRLHCLKKPNVTESFPFDQWTIVFKVANKMFTLANVQKFDSINVKCDPEKALALRSSYEGVIPGWHMNKKHWNTLLLNQDLDDISVYRWINESYDLVVAQLPQRTRENLDI